MHRKVERENFKKGMNFYSIEAMKKSFFFGILMISSLILPACSSSDPADTLEIEASSDTNANWVSLFDGKTFNGWHTYGKDSVTNAWKIEDSAIHLISKEKNGWQTVGGGDLVTDEEYSNFDLKLQWKISKAGNSGIFFYVREDADKFKNANQTGLEMQINDDANNQNGVTGLQKVGDLVGLKSSSSEKFVRPAGEWNEVEIRSSRGKLNFFMNGHNVLTTTLWDDNWENLIENSKFRKLDDYGTFKKGRIVLQDHGADVWFKNIMIKKF